METFASGFKSYSENVLELDEASWEEISECRRAFHAGARWAMKMLAEATDLPSEDDGVVQLEVMHQELNAFGDAVEKGQA